jgi:hypothetical protein
MPCRTGWTGGAARKCCGVALRQVRISSITFMARAFRKVCASAALRAIIATGSISGAGCADVVMPLPEGVCELSRPSEFFSPGKTRKVVIFDRRCGSGAPERQVSVLEAAAVLENTPGNVLTERVDPRARERLAQLEMSWTGEGKLTISRNPSMIVAKVENRASEVEITHLVRVRDEEVEEFLDRRRER